MSPWEDRIINVFMERYPASAAAKIIPQPGSPPDNENCSAENRVLRIPAAKVFPHFDKASPDEKESFLDAAESLEAQQLLSLVWVRHRKGELLSALICPDMEKLYRLTGRASPKTAAQAAQEAAREAALNAAGAFFSFLAKDISASDAARGITAESIQDMALLFRALAKPVNLTLRALSVSLYNDSKKLEALINSYKAVFARAERQGIAFPDLSFLDRAIPETYLAGKFCILFKDPGSVPLLNAAGAIINLPLVTIQKIDNIEPWIPETSKETPPPSIVPAPSVLLIENKETFFTLAASPHNYNCLLYAGGHPNRAVRALAGLLAKSGFAFYHAGDLDPDGILILQELQGIIDNAGTAGQTLMPVCMDAPTFERYLKHGKKLAPSMLRRISLITDKTRALPGMAELIKKIETTGKGIEQEIIDYYQ
ncbi:hypothetical protein AGMMS49546_27670 [Spirochaetia bacterium]|nr:hypothetical protein AGMMS49546_27670 [Spirochaetia bacterium]